jgi:restriction system protein
MAIPTYETIMLPLLSELADGETRTFGELVPVLESHFLLTESERTEMLPSGRITTFRSRMHWAATYMVHACLLERPQRGRLRLTERGRAVLAGHPAEIDNDFLNQFPEFVEWRAKSGVKPPTLAPSNKAAGVGPGELTPEEILESSYQTLRLQLADELLEKLKNSSPAFFEQVVVDLLVAMGYGGSRPGVAQAIGKSGDGGIDGVIKEDKLGLDVVYIQAKRWQGTVGRPEIQKFAGSLMGMKATKGVFITTGSFSKDAELFARSINQRIVLIDGEELAGYLIDHDVGVTSAATYVVKRIDNDYFDEA